jgi:hypothetical protein
MHLDHHIVTASKGHIEDKELEVIRARLSQQRRSRQSAEQDEHGGRANKLEYVHAAIIEAVDEAEVQEGG